MKKIGLIFVLIIETTLLVASDTLKILSWNIFMVPPVVFKSCQQTRAHMIADYMLSQEPDIIILQEAFMKKTRIIIENKLSETYPFQSAVTKSGVLKSNSGICIFSKTPILKQDFITYINKEGTDIFSKKGATFTEISIQNKTIQIIGTHTQSLSKFQKTREQQFQQLKTHLSDKHFSPSIPQFIIGDMNANYYDTSVYRRMLDIFDTAPVEYSGEKYSWDGINNDLAAKYFEHIQETLDYVLLRKSSEHSAQIINTEILKTAKDTCFCKKSYFHLSDHNPLISTIQIH